MDHPGCNEGEGSDQSWISRARRLISASLPLRSDKSTPAVSQWTDGITFSCCGAARYTFHISRARMSSERSPRFFLSPPPPRPREHPGAFLPLCCSAVALARTRFRLPGSGSALPKAVSQRETSSPPPSGDTTLPHFAVIVAGDDRCVKIISRAPVCRRRFFRAALRPGDPRPPDLRVTFAPEELRLIKHRAVAAPTSQAAPPPPFSRPSSKRTYDLAMELHAEIISCSSA